MNEDTHETPSGGLETSPAVDDGPDPVTPRDHTSAEPLSECEAVSEIDLSNPPVQSPSDEPDCDVEELLKETVESVVAYVHGTPDDFEPVVPTMDPASSSDATEECSSIQNTIPETSDILHDKEVAHDVITDEQAVDIPDEATPASDNINDVNDDDDDFGEFGDFSNAHTVESSVFANGVSEFSDANDHNVRANAAEDEDDDFGDFEEADFGRGAPTVPLDEFARFDDAPFNPDPKFLDDSVAPVSAESFRNLIAELFAVVDHSGSDLLDRPVETGHFHASVHRDIARCENVDDWPCVLFRYDSSRTRKTLLSSLCIDETPANCPRFAIDCLSNEFLQPVKESREGGLSTPRDGRELSEKAKEVLNKIPDLSFMKAEVLTFPTAVQAPWSAL